MPNENETPNPIATVTKTQEVATRAGEMALTGPEGMAAFLALLQTKDENAEQFDGDINQNKLVKKLALSKDSPLYGMFLDKEQIDTRSFWYVVLTATYGSRALFPPQNHPDKDKYQSPICSTNLHLPEDIQAGADKGKGFFKINPHFETPYALRDGEGHLIEHPLDTVVALDCARCPFNKFESERVWDPSKGEGRGKACKESRLFFAQVLQKDSSVPPFTDRQGREYYFFKEDPNYLEQIRIPLTLGANKKSIDNLFMAAKARNFPVNSLVLKVSVKIEEEAGTKWAVFVGEIVGFPTPSVVAGRADAVAWVHDYVKRNAKALASDVEAPF